MPPQHRRGFARSGFGGSRFGSFLLCLLCLLWLLPALPDTAEVARRFQGCQDPAMIASAVLPGT